MTRAPTTPAASSKDLQEAVARLQQGMQVLSNNIVRLTQRVSAVEAGEKLRAEGRTPVMPIEFRSQYGEDLFLWQLLGGQTEGFFIEVGAFDGYHYSVTYALECLGWRGLLIEAHPERVGQCRERRKNSRVVHAALSKRGASGEAEFTMLEDQYGGMLSYHRTSAEHQRGLLSQGFKQSKAMVPVTCMNELLKDHSGPIDVAVIDVEGAELDVLDGFDLVKYRPRVLLIEENAGQAPVNVGTVMRTQPYVQVGWVAVNRVFVRADETALQERVRTMAL